MRIKSNDFATKLIYFYPFSQITSLLELLIREIVTNFPLFRTKLAGKCVV